MRALLAEIERVLPDGGEWCTVDKAHGLAALVLAFRPRITVEIGVWQGGSLIPMLLAMKHTGKGRAIAIDPWAHDASVADQTAPNAAWWGNVDHGAAYRKFLARLELHELLHLCTICHRSSDLCEPPSEIDLLHVDGNHGPQAATSNGSARACRSAGSSCSTISDGRAVTSSARTCAPPSSVFATSTRSAPGS